MDYSDTTKTHREVWAERADEVELLAHEYVKARVGGIGGEDAGALLAHPPATHPGGNSQVGRFEGEIVTGLRALSQESQAYWLGGNQ